MSEQSSGGTERRYICTSCETIVRARWFGPGSFAVGCDCQTVPVVPQMGQDETPDKWRVERPDCCRDAESKDLETIYGERGKDYRCPDCGAEYFWDGKMVGAPDTDEREIRADGGTVGGGMEHSGGTLNHPDGDRCDLEFCQCCGHAFTTAIEGYWVGPADVGPDAEGGTAEVFRLDVEEQLGHEWEGFKEEDTGAWCGHCSWIIQRRRTRNDRTLQPDTERPGADSE